MNLLSGFFWTLSGVSDVPLSKVYDVPVTGVLDFSLSGDLSFLLLCFTDNWWFSFIWFNEIEDQHSPDLTLLMWDRFSGMIQILDVCSGSQTFTFISLLVRSSNLGTFLNLKGFGKSSVCSLHKKWNFPLKNSPVNVTKSAVSCGFDHIYWRNP